MSSEEDLDSVTQLKLRILRDELTKLQENARVLESELVKLREENSRFRLICLTPATHELPEIDKLHLAQRKILWQNEEIETVLLFLEVYEKHHQILQEIVLEKRGKKALTEYVRERDNKKFQEAKALRENPPEKKKAAANASIMYSNDPDEHKAIKGYVKMFRNSGMSEELAVAKAKEMIQSFKKGLEKT